MCYINRRLRELPSNYSRPSNNRFSWLLAGVSDRSSNGWGPFRPCSQVCHWVLRWSGIQIVFIEIIDDLYYWRGIWAQCRWSERTCMHSSMQISFNSFKHWQGGRVKSSINFAEILYGKSLIGTQINLPNVYLPIQSHSEMCSNCTLLGPRLYCQSDFYID